MSTSQGSATSAETRQPDPVRVQPGKALRRVRVGGADDLPVVAGKGLLRRLPGAWDAHEAALRALAFKWIRILYHARLGRPHSL
jgi:hypothetical protein